MPKKAEKVVSPKDRCWFRGSCAQRAEQWCCSFCKKKDCDRRCKADPTDCIYCMTWEEVSRPLTKVVDQPVKQKRENKNGKKPWEEQI